MKKSLIILSGGMDSVTLLYQKKEEIGLAVTFDYGANLSRNEIECARYHCRKLGVRHIVIELPFISVYFKSSLLRGADSVPNAFGDDGKDKSSTIVPFRNGIMMSIACGMAESMGYTNVLIATQVGGTSVCTYPDCSRKFLDAFSSACTLGTTNNVTIEAPYGEMEKSEIVKIGESFGVDYTKTYSCYKGGDKHCGVCGTCIKRKEAFDKAGIIDKTIYEQ